MKFPKGWVNLTDSYINSYDIYAGDVILWGRNVYLVVSVKTTNRPHALYEVTVTDIATNFVRIVYFGKDDCMRHCKKVISYKELCSKT